MLLLLAIGLGLLGFIEPCTIGAHLLFTQCLSKQERQKQLLYVVLFTLTRALLIGLLGVVAAFLGSAFFHLQRVFWVVLGMGYVVVGMLYFTQKHGWLMPSWGPDIQHGYPARHALVLGVLLGLNVPACAVPLLMAVLGASFGAATIGQGFLIMTIFGIALSVPLLLVLAWERARKGLVRFTRFSASLPQWTGLAFVVLGLWSIRLGLVST